MKKIKWVVLFTLIFLIPLMIIIAIDNYFSDRVNTYINNQVQSHASYIFTNLVKNQVTNSIDMDDLLILKYDNANQIDSVIIDTRITNKILGDVGEKITDYLTDEELKSSFKSVSIPLGFLVSKYLFATRGPMIDIPIMPLGTYIADIYTNAREYGINNTILEVYLQLTVDLQAFLPLQPKKINCTTKIILVSQVIQGDVPRYYYVADGKIPYIPEDNQMD